MIDNGPDDRRHRSLSVLAALASVAILFGSLLHASGAEARPALTPRTATETSFAHSVTKLLNAERAQHHLKPLTTRSALLNSARGHDLAMARANVMAHQVSGEKPLGTRITAAGYPWTWAGENIGWNSAMTAAGVLALQKAMYDERPPNDGHRLNILNSHFTDVGVDVYLDKAHRKAWLTLDFGRR